MKFSEQDEDMAGPATRREAMVPVLAVSAVAVVAVVAAVMVKRTEQIAPDAPQAMAQVDRPVADVDVVTAPPLKAPSTRSMGAAPACRECGVVQVVVAVYAERGKQPRAYEMHIRMDDGTERTIEQRGALAAGSRVIVRGDAVKPMS